MRDRPRANPGLGEGPDLWDVDAGRSEKLLPDRGAKLLHIGIEVEARKQDATGQREAVRVNAPRLDAHDDVPRLHRGSIDEPLVGDHAHGHPDEVESLTRLRAAQKIRNLRHLPPDDADACLLRTLCKTGPDGREDVRIRRLDRDVIEHRERRRSDTEQVVHVHGDAVDPDGVVPTGELRDEQLGADPVGREGQAERTDPDHAREMADRDLGRGAEGERGCDLVEEPGERAVRLVRVDPASGVVRGHGAQDARAFVARRGSAGGGPCGAWT